MMKIDTRKELPNDQNVDAKVAICPAVSLYIYTTYNGKVAELEVKARQLEIELALTIEKFGTVIYSFLLATLSSLLEPSF